MRGCYTLKVPSTRTWKLSCSECLDEVDQGVFWLGTHFCRRCGAFMKYPPEFYIPVDNIYIRQFIEEETEIEQRISEKG